MTAQPNGHLIGLTSSEAKALREKWGTNELTPQTKESFIHKVWHVISEPMFLLLIGASVIYFILGEPKDGAVMLIFVVGIISIDIYQEWKTDQTLNALKDLSAPRITVLRDGIETVINSADLVPGDIMLIHEGIKVPADGTVLRASTLSIDESSLTGEALAVTKVPAGTAEESSIGHSGYWRTDWCYAGTLVIHGTGAIRVEKTGPRTEYGKIGRDIAEAPDIPTPLQIQTQKLVKACAAIAAALFVFVGFITYFNIPDHPFNDRIIESVLSGVTLAMAMIPEEFPVILAVFLSMGAWRLARKNSLVRRLSSVETLGAVSVLCVDKTGTITLNTMTVQELWTEAADSTEAARIMGMACKPDAYDPMEKAMIRYCEERGISRDALFGGELIQEYAFTNTLKMMGNVWKHEDAVTVAAKGSPEHLLELCILDEPAKSRVETKVTEMLKSGLRVIAVGLMELTEPADVPGDLTRCRLKLCGIVGLADPPRESVKQDVETCTRAGVRVVMITGDNGLTAASIAKQIGMPGSDRIMTGDELSATSDEDLRQKVRDIRIFSRVIPEHKMRIVNAFKKNGDVVAMTGDGVNDATALKYADIGIAMGKRGSEVSREASDLILLDDNFSTIVQTIRDGRRIYDNIRKAVGYVFTIHIPIAFAALLAPMLGISPAFLLLLPIHVVLLELIIDPTCSVVLERQPAEPDIMNRPPRDPKESLLTKAILLKSVLQGIAVFAASFGTYCAYLAQYPDNGALARTMGLIIIMLANMFLVQVNSSNLEFAYRSMRRLIHDKVMWAINIGTVLGLGIMLYTPLSGFLRLYPLAAPQLMLALFIAFAAVFWYEGVKLVKHRRRRMSGAE